ncbi:MAG: type I phosphomannose isomerase catalytic subunit [Planctomycetota bacterium]
MEPYPVRFRPVFKRTIWGGRRLNEQLGKSIGPESDYAESWEVVDHGDDQSVVDGGPLDGLTLNQLIVEHDNWLLGSGAQSKTFPLLLKYLDCNRVLSVQVHPDDAYGATMPKPDLGKTEAWYIVAADPESKVYAGLQPGVDRKTLQEAIAAGQAEQVLHAFHPQPGDVIYIPAGTVHALGAGLLVAEIQQSSDTTFRLFDWNRVDADGNARPLHLEQGLEVSDYETGPVEPRRVDPMVTGWQNVVASDKFLLRLLATGSTSLAGDGEFHIVTVPKGNATLVTGEETILLNAGETLLLPAAMGACEITVAESGVVMGMSLPQ